MSVLAILQARMSSSRLPGKVMLPILGQPMIALQIERLLCCRLIDKLVLATSTEASDDPLAQLAESRGWDCFRGPLNDVLGRFQMTALAYGPAAHIVRSTADCPLIDPAVVDATIAHHIASEADYTSNSLPGQRTFPDGLDIEVMTASALDAAAAAATEPRHREHVTMYIYENPDRFRVRAYKQARDLGELRWTVDTERDLGFVRAVFEEIYPHNTRFGQDDVLSLLARRPELTRSN